MNISIGDLFVTENKKVLYLVVRVRGSRLHLERYNLDTKEKSNTTLYQEFLTNKVDEKQYIYYPVKK